MRALLSMALAVAACAPASRLPHSIALNTAGTDRAAAGLYVKHYLNEELDERLHCNAMWADDEVGAPAALNVAWLSWPEYERRLSADGISTPIEAGGKVELVIADRELPPWESTTGTLSDCEAAYLVVFWVGQSWGLPRSETSGTITYPHPDCSNGAPAFDWIGDLVEQLSSRGIDACEDPNRGRAFLFR